MKRVALLLALAGTPAAAAPASQTTVAAPACPFAGQSDQLVVQMFFGQSIRGGLISRRAWARFVADTITPALPGGFTLTAGSGQWQDRATRMVGFEPTEILLVAGPDSPVLRDAVAGIAAAYRQRFDQRLVGIVSTMGCAAF